jgi:hypothetical protein
MDRFENLIKSLCSLARDPTLEEHDALRGAEGAIKDYLKAYRGTE